MMLSMPGEEKGHVRRLVGEGEAEEWHGGLGKRREHTTEIT
jgi:hypothetical protein